MDNNNISFALVTFTPIAIEPKKAPVKIYFTSFPGLEISVQGESYIHPIEMDDLLQRLSAGNVKMIVALASESELPTGAIPELRKFAKKLDIEVVNLPIHDFSIPDEEGEKEWGKLSKRIHVMHEIGVPICFSCLSGKGRAGMFAARMLYELGVESKEAIHRVRYEVANAIETDEQEMWVGKEINVEGSNDG